MSASSANWETANRGAERNSHLSQLFHEHERALRSFLRRFLKNEDDIADTAQDVFVRVAQMHDLSKLDLHARAYLFRIAEHLVIDRVRRNKSRCVDLQEQLTDDIDVESPKPSVDEQIHWRQSMAHFASQCEAAGQRVAQAIELSYLNDMTHPEIAKQLGVTTRTVERYMRYARRLCEPLTVIA